MTFLPCGHNVMCEACSKNMPQLRRPSSAYNYRDPFGRGLRNSTNYKCVVCRSDTTLTKLYKS